VQQTLLESIYEAANATLPPNIMQRLESEKANKTPTPFSAICRFAHYLLFFAYPILSSYLMLKVNHNKGEDINRLTRQKEKSFVMLFLQSLLGIDTRRERGIKQTDLQDMKNLGSLTVCG
jgi:hypothetical protein